jgi:hypothetical protein
VTLRYSYVVALTVLSTTASAADMQPVLKAPAAVDQQATGYVEVYSGFANTKLNATLCDLGDGCETQSNSTNGWALGGAGRGNYWISRDVSVQIDAQAEGTSFSNSALGGHVSNHSYLVGGHWSWRSPDQYLFGLFAAAGDAGGFNTSQRHGVIGAEAQWYWNHFTFYAQGGYDTTLGTIGNGVDGVNAWFIRGTGRYFINPNFLIEGTVMYANGNIDINENDFPSIRYNTWTWGAKAEWRLPSAPFSVFANYQGSETKFDTIFVERSSVDFKVRDHRVLLGLKLHMGDRTLQQTDRAGATLDIKSPLADPSAPLMSGLFEGI